MEMYRIPQTPYEISPAQLERVRALGDRVMEMRRTGPLNPEYLHRLRRFFRIKNIYHSNAIEGNRLNVGETRDVVERGLTITGKPLKDQAEARNLSEALDYLEELAKNTEHPITEFDIRQLHHFVLKGIRDDEAGSYRRTQVEISGSKHKPTSPEKLAVEMAEFGQWLRLASMPKQLFDPRDAILAASAAHAWFVTIHPFIDGNGRVSRLLMNLMLMRYGFPIAIVTREDRMRYYDALEESQSSDLTPFVELIAECVEESLVEYEKAAEEQREQIEWAESIAQKLEHKERVAASNRYEVWKNAMDLMKSVFRQNADLLTESAKIGEVRLRDFGMLEFEKYLSLKNHASAKKTWFFRMDFRIGEQTVRYLFFFGWPSFAMPKETDVTVLISREDPPGSFHYSKLDDISSPNVPSIVEIGYNLAAETFVVRTRSGSIQTEKVEKISRDFIQNVIDKHFSS
jgi:Fic family protein